MYDAAIFWEECYGRVEKSEHLPAIKRENWIFSNYLKALFFAFFIMISWKFFSF